MVLKRTMTITGRQESWLKIAAIRAVNNSYREFQDYTNSTLYNYVKKAEDLLPESFDISPEQLRKAMTTSYNLDNKMANDVVH